MLGTSCTAVAKHSENSCRMAPTRSHEERGAPPFVGDVDIGICMKELQERKSVLMKKVKR